MFVFAEATLQAAFAPFGMIQNIKLIKEKGVSGSAVAAAAKQPRVTAASPCFKLAAAQQGLLLPQGDRVRHDIQYGCYMSRLGPTMILGRDPCAVHQSELGVGSSFLLVHPRRLL